MYCFFKKNVSQLAHRKGNTSGLRFLNLKSSSIALEQLKSRSLLRIQGVDTAPFLQGLITNDIKLLDCKHKSLYAMFLNASGRVLYDSLIYRVANQNDDFLIECDRSVLKSLINHLNLFRVRKKVKISIPNYLVWVAFIPDDGKKLLSALIESDEKLITVSKDSRLEYLGHRLIVDGEVNKQSIKNLFSQDANFDDNITYLEHRYTLGIGEGVIDFPPGKCFPMECNCDYLRGISFNKGCYIGQELTARTHHTGVTRKRLMPLFFENQMRDDKLSENAEINSTEGSNVGRLRGTAGHVGLGLLRVEKIEDNQRLVVDNQFVCTTHRPHWWLKQ